MLYAAEKPAKGAGTKAELRNPGEAVEPEEKAVNPRRSW